MRIVLAVLPVDADAQVGGFTGQWVNGCFRDANRVAAGVTLQECRSRKQ